MADFDPGEGWREVTDTSDMYKAVLVNFEDPKSRGWVREAPVPPLPTEPLKKRIRDISQARHDLARSLAEALPWNLGNVVIALAQDDLQGAQAALSAEFARRYPAVEPEGGQSE